MKIGVRGTDIDAPQQYMCCICGEYDITHEFVLGIAVDDAYQSHGVVCWDCLALDENGIREELRRQTYPEIELAEGEGIQKPPLDVLRQAARFFESSVMKNDRVPQENGWMCYGTAYTRYHGWFLPTEKE